MRLTAKLLVGIGVVALLLPACRRKGDVQTIYMINEGTGVGVNVQNPATEARLNRVGFLEPEMVRRVAVQRTGASRTATNTLEIFAVFRNRTNYDQTIQVRTQFFGPARNPNEGPHEWQTVFLPPNGIETYRTYSHGTDCEFYYIEVMSMR
ncbi:MAG: hypothetical protein GY851_02200 [bacterium]|nr:hypothetical protein [bacterium]